MTTHKVLALSAAKLSDTTRSLLDRLAAKAVNIPDIHVYGNNRNGWIVNISARTFDELHTENLPADLIKYIDKAFSAHYKTMHFDTNPDAKSSSGPFLIYSNMAVLSMAHLSDATRTKLSSEINQPSWNSLLISNGNDNSIIVGLNHDYASADDNLPDDLVECFNTMIRRNRQHLRFIQFKQTSMMDSELPVYAAV